MIKNKIIREANNIYNVLPKEFRGFNLGIIFMTLITLLGWCINIITKELNIKSLYMLGSIFLLLIIIKYQLKIYSNMELFNKDGNKKRLYNRRGTD